MKAHRWITTAVAAAALGCAASALAAYPEKNIKLIIPTPPGGGFHVYAQAVAPYLAKYLGNDIKVVLENMPGSGFRRATSALYNAKPDGYTIGLVGIGITLLPQVKGDKLDYDLHKFTWIGRLAYDGLAIGVKKDSPINSIADLKALNRPIKWPHTQRFYPGVFAAALGYPIQVITGYKGGRDYITAVVRGDGEAFVHVPSSTRGFIKSGKVKLIALFDDRYKKEFPGIPTADDLGHPELKKVTTERLLAGPPGMPTDITQKLVTALEKSIADPELQAWSKKAKRPFQPLTPKGVKAVVDGQFEFFEPFKKLID
ncbi:MAG: hypothetical protein A3G25_10245 [Betaproteobacteria bacterium RIFCSPLOWO2_12_FULL_63_13]|nr:MAG: hypothetical protein A3H32_13855 [Betaproteobacteria bacterium RIFCSPLOWO2_02_FULL_63_19]OGA43062.1 MAG: hypothetical protein A3G25_10245 [Betaproteobacteria bacterium RIFCSPLOWO2_12_FULL_63_13]